MSASFSHTPPSVSVILTVFRRTAFLAEAIESAWRQTAPPAEIIVTDDSDQPEVRAICDRFAGAPVRYRSNPKPLGPGRNIAAAASEAHGDLVAILNDDDLWEPDFLESLLPAFAVVPQCVLAFSDHWIMSADGEIDEAASVRNTACYGRDHLPAGVVADPAAVVLRDNGVPLAMAALFRRDAVDWEALPAEVTGAYDFWIASRLAASGRPFYFVPQRLTRYRLHAAMETARQSADKNENMIFLFRDLLSEDPFPAWRRLLRAHLSNALRASGRDRLRFDDPLAARARFRESWSARPNPKAAAGWLATWLPKGLRNIF